MHHWGGASQKVTFALIPVKVLAPDQTEFVPTYAGLDNFSSDCFVSDLDKLKITGPAAQILLTTMQHKRAPNRTKIIAGLEVTDMDENVRITLPLVYSKEELLIGDEDIPRAEDVEEWPDLRNLPFNLVEAGVGLIIGINVSSYLKRSNVWK